jgi:hypothetical protein
MQRTGINQKTALGATLFFIFAANSMACVFAVDSFTQVMAIFFGILSVKFYLSNVRGKYFYWILCGLIACFSKESGFVFFVTAPFVKALVDNQQGKINNVKEFFTTYTKLVLIACVPALVFLSVYFGMQQLYIDGDGLTVTSVSSAVPTDSFSTIEKLTTTSSEHKLTPATLLKNVGVLYVLGIFPVDTSGVYYSNWGVVALTLLLALFGLILLWRLFRKFNRKDWIRLTISIILVLIYSAPFMLTRAGELSSCMVNMFIALFIALLFNDYKIRKFDVVLLIIFTVCTLITDIHKYSLAYTGGKIGVRMGNEVKEKSIENPNIVLWIGFNERFLDKAGAAFNKSPFKAFGQGAAAKRAYNYKYPVQMDKLLFPSQKYDQNMVDSVVSVSLEQYDCIWITYGDKVQVINGKR